jgi:heme/copper-type cytochrome/quinol oxidase subunit 2
MNGKKPEAMPPAFFLYRRRTIDAMRELLVVSMIAAGLAGAAMAQEPGAPNRREFTIVAKDYAFTPDTLEVTQDDLVKVTLRSEDRPASFAIDAYRIVKRAAGGRSTTFEFRADQAGTFPFYCNLTSDAACQDMRGTLIVKAR